MNINHSTLVGRVANEPKFTPAEGTKKARLFLILAVNRLKLAGQEKAAADYVPCTLWGKNAEAGHKNITIGKELGIEGQIRTSAVKGEDGKMTNYFSVSCTMCSYGRDSQKKQQADEAAAQTPSDEADELLEEAAGTASADAPF